MKVLAIETSCDETGIALVEGKKAKRGFEFKTLKASLLSQAALHAPYGGVYPTLAKREHQKNLPVLFKGFEGEPFDAIAVTVGPGLEPALWQGIVFAQELAQKRSLPLMPVNHMEAHLISSLVQNEKLESVHLPVLALLVSGGHTEFVLMQRWFEYEVVGETLDDAVGECFDKVARMLGLPYPGGPEVYKLALDGNPSAINFPRPMLNQKNYNFSFSGLKTAVRQMVQGPVNIDDISASFQAAVIDILCDRSRLAMAMFRRDFPAAKNFVVAGGVAANQAIGKALTGLSEEEGFLTQITPPRLCTDNAAMIAWAGIERLSDNIRGDALSVSPRARWPLGVVPARFEPNT